MLTLPEEGIIYLGSPLMSNYIYMWNSAMWGKEEMEGIPFQPKELV